MSIPLVQNNEKDSINTSIIAIKRNIERINMLLGLSNSEEIDTSKFATKEELQQAVTDLQPVDEVAVDNMHSVSSNAVANAMGWSFTEQKVGVFDDGSALYRKMVKGTIPANGDYTFSINVPNFKNMIKWSGAFYFGGFSNPLYVFNIPFIYLSGSPITDWLNTYCYFYHADKCFNCAFIGGGTFASSYFTGEVIFFCEYTKTTD